MLEEWICGVGLRWQIDEILHAQGIVASLVIPEEDKEESD